MASYRLEVKASAVKEIGAVPRKDRQRVVTRIQALAENPLPHGCEKLSGATRYRTRQGDYQVVYGIDDNEHLVTIVKIGNRRDVYR